MYKDIPASRWQTPWGQGALLPHLSTPQVAGTGSCLWHVLHNCVSNGSQHWLLVRGLSFSPLKLRIYHKGWMLPKDSHQSWNQRRYTSEVQLPPAITYDHWQQPDIFCFLCQMRYLQKYIWQFPVACSRAVNNLTCPQRYKNVLFKTWTLIVEKTSATLAARQRLHESARQSLSICGM